MPETATPTGERAFKSQPATTPKTTRFATGWGGSGPSTSTPGNWTRSATPAAAPAQDDGYPVLGPATTLLIARYRLGTEAFEYIFEIAGQPVMTWYDALIECLPADVPDDILEAFATAMFTDSINYKYNRGM